MKKTTLFFSALLFFFSNLSQAQTIMFDDFNYTGINDVELNSFNKWNVIDGLNGPPANAIYDENNLWFAADSNDASNSIMWLQTSVDGVNKTATQCRIETSGYDYFEGTYAARVNFSNLPNTYGDANIQTFYTIVSYLLAGDGSKYSELDFEYMATDKWGTSTNNEVMYMTAWNRYIASPWAAWKNHITDVQRLTGWHTLIVSATDGTNVKFWIDGVYFGALTVTDNDATSVYPRSNMQVAFANWIWNDGFGPSSDDRKAAMRVDWVLHVKDEEKTPLEVDNIVNGYRINNIDRVNLQGDEHKIITSNSIEKKDIEMSVFPNPNADGNFTLNTTVESLMVFDSMGKKLFEVNNSNKIDLANYPSGIYFLNTGKSSIKILKM